jgi:hypothetical protein
MLIWHKNLSAWRVCRMLYVEMKAKQTVKQLFLGLILAVLCGVGLFAPQSANAATCGGVQTSIIACTQKGTCADSEQPFEGIEPKTDVDKAAYLKEHGHNYGLCNGDVRPATSDTSNSGVWGVLLIAINILTAGVGVAAIGGIIYGSILYTSAGGSPEQVKKAMGIITNVVIGVVAYALMFSGLNFIIPGGLFAP